MGRGDGFWIVGTMPGYEGKFFGEWIPTFVGMTKGGGSATLSICHPGNSIRKSQHFRNFLMFEIEHTRCIIDN